MIAQVLGIALAATLLFPASHARAGAHVDVVLEWNAIMASSTSGLNPFAQARVVAITQLAVFEAVNAISDQFEPYRGPLSAPPGASAEAAAVTAAHDVLVNYLPLAATSLDASEATSLAAIPDGQSKDDGIAVGADAAAALIALRSSDGAGPAQFFQPQSSDPGVWQPTASCPPAGGILFHWQNVTPFGIETNAQFRSAPPPGLSSARYARDYNEVLRVGAVDSADRPADRADVARLFNSLLAVGTWNAVARQLSEGTGTSLAEDSRILALLNMAISDGLTSSMETKYHVAFWRPETAIRAGDADGNSRTAGDAGFAPFLTTPCFPAYPSAHASGSYAARSILGRAWGDGGHSLVLSHPVLPGRSFSYTSLKQITDDIDDARVYGGIHFRFDQEAGAVQGRKIGQYVYAHHLLPDQQ